MVQLKFKRGGKMEKYLDYCYGSGSPFDTPNNFCRLLWGLVLSPLALPISSFLRMLLVVMRKVDRILDESRNKKRAAAIARVLDSWEKNPHKIAADYYQMYSDRAVCDDFSIKSAAMNALCQKNNVFGTWELFIKLGFVSVDYSGNNYTEENFRSYYDEIYPEAVVTPKKEPMSLQIVAWFSNMYHFVVSKTCPIVRWED